MTACKRCGFDDGTAKDRVVIAPPQFTGGYLDKDTQYVGVHWCDDCEAVHLHDMERRWLKASNGTKWGD